MTKPIVIRFILFTFLVGSLSVYTDNRIYNSLITNVHIENLDEIEECIDEDTDANTLSDPSISVLIITFWITSKETVKLLIKKVATIQTNLSWFISAALIWIIWKSYRKKTVLSIESSADMSVCDEDHKALIWAAWKGHKELVELLVKKGTDVNAKDKNEWGETALMYAAEWGHLETVKLLIDKGANVNARDDVGQTALMYATLGDQKEIVELLIRKGIDLEAKNMMNETALTIAIERYHEEIVAILRKAV